MYYLYFDANCSFEESSELDFSWWKDLVRIYLNKADYFEIRLWKGQETQEALAFCENYSAYVEEDSYQHIYSGMIDENLKEELLRIAIGKLGQPIFFSLWLYREGEQILASDHYGMEFMLLGFDEHSVVAAAEELEQVYGVKEIQIYTDENQMLKEEASMTDDEIQEIIHALNEEG